MRIRAGLRNLAALLAVAAVAAAAWGCGSGLGDAAKASGSAAPAAGAAPVVAASGDQVAAPGAEAPAAASEAAPAATGPSLQSLLPGRAVLVSGSKPVKGLPGFGRNALSALSGGYAYLPKSSAASQSPAEPLKVDVWFTRERLVFPPEWAAGAPVACRTLPVGFTVLASLAEESGSTLWAIGGTVSVAAAGASEAVRDFTVIVRMPAALADPCRFATVIAERLGFFQRYAERDEDASFPAVLDIGR